MDTAQIVWLVLVVLFGILEGVTVSIVSIWFCLGALAALLVSLLFPGAMAAQVIIFFAVSIVALLALRPMASRLIGGRRVATNADANIGKVCQVIAEVQPGRFGRVKLEGLDWTARSDAVLPVGSWCRVVAIEGVKLVVVPLEAPPPPRPPVQAPPPQM